MQDEKLTKHHYSLAASVFIYSIYLSSNSKVLTTLIFFHGVLVGL
jgi:hypothetical protein